MAQNTSSNKSVELLLNESVEHLGIVGDVVKVKPGYARNYLLPLGIAEYPSEEKVEALKEQRAIAKAEYDALLSARAETIDKLSAMAVKLIRSCNDQGVLYGSVTQRDIADALVEAGYKHIDERAVRLSQPIRRVGDYSVLIQFGRDLRTEIGIHVEADRSLEQEMEAQDREAAGESEGAETPAAEGATETPATESADA